MAWDMYQERILDHYKRPRNFGHLDHPDLTGSENNPLCGDRITVELSLDGAKKTIQDVKFNGDGCAISVASASMLTSKIKGQPLAQVSKTHRQDVEKMLAIPLSPVRIKCALTSLKALANALGATDTPLDTSDGGGEAEAGAASAPSAGNPA
ncbi:MAG: SUF system NifU family Fe-S cluster assembly protein [Euryarchaeota archaeon]|nr:SUF system NifU family Fe-S cluster assembly protein [Euryarchaeota archaeon]MDE1836196.1 SUF system NifU family Fe-S cluster assembly protein [Euryarchaeota archaeon]MDE1881179.1 SUF system NifU family Fe-S cluster assembly protein [Euryarchaeota archaeon]MDE2045441.1 SUF system NifU family Fe-S cluster assembly protein [Thermoplasmata archaeon]